VATQCFVVEKTYQVLVVGAQRLSLLASAAKVALAFWLNGFVFFLPSVTCSLVILPSELQSWVE